MELIIKQSEIANPVYIPGYKDRYDSQSILRLTGSGNYTQLYLANALMPLLISQTLKYFEPVLPRFIRISKSALINPDYVREVIDEGCKQLQIVLADGTVMDVSRRRISETKAQLFNYQYDEKKRIWTVLHQSRLTPLWRYHRRKNSSDPVAGESNTAQSIAG